MKYPLSCLRPALKVGTLLLGFAAATSSLVAAITVNLVPSRTTGVAPLAVYFDASTTTATGVVHPMHNLSFEWDFGDPGSGTWAISGQSQNFATGPAAAHVFKTPGTYQVSVSVTDGGSQSSSQTVTITVTDPNTVFSGTKTICFAPDGVFTGAPTGAALVTTSSMSTVMSYAASNRRLLLKRGASFAGGNFTISAAGPGIIGSFGTHSSRPRLTGFATYFNFASADWRVLDLEFQGPSSGNTAALSGSQSASDILIMNTRAVPNTLHRAFSSAVTAPDKLFIVENHWQALGVSGNAGTNGGNIIYTMANRLAVLGNHLEDASGGEHIFRLVECKKGVISHNYFAHPHESKALLTIRSTHNGETHEVLVSDNTFITDWGNIGMVNRNDSTHTVYGRDIIVERNFFKRALAHGKASTFAINTESVDRVTIRNNVALFNDWGPTLVDARDDRPKPVNSLWIYNNSVYSPDNNSTASPSVAHIRSGSGHVVRNNLVYAPGLGSAWALVRGTGSFTASHNLRATTNPYLASTITAPAHFQLSSTSAALNAGAAVPVFDDYDLNPRPNGTARDIGAYEAVSNLLSHGTFAPNQATVLQDMTNPYVLGTGAANIWQGRVGALASQTTTYQTDGSGNPYLTVGTSINGPGAFQVITWPGAGTKQVSFSYRGTNAKVRIYRGTTGDTINKFDGWNSLILIQELSNPSASSWTTATHNVTLSGTYNYLVIQLRAGDFDNVSIAP